ncbi:hypothetical protein PSTG_07344 [Puccinia striiformis f. sp. tritici PST-78]|uniref:Uncharacterized protein n=1 Tax=Puccinia striiformis f. sp. tritici PST-78 TaxID=1165861 RepID=A0A0L0VJG6_9BASI|nr:hypothetical protein PSTG_07344 [Puccinia striiformis f. sp. tritici PST-78]
MSSATTPINNTDEQASPNLTNGDSDSKHHSPSSPSSKSYIYGLSDKYQEYDPLEMPSRTLWSSILNDASYHPAAVETPTNPAEFIEFATPFLSQQYLLKLNELFDKLAQSEAGLDYTLRHPNLAILDRILTDLQQLNNGAGDDKQNHGQINSTHDQNLQTHQERVGSSQMDNSDDDGSNNQSILDMYPRCEHSFEKAIIVPVPIPAFSTSPVNVEEQNLTIKARSNYFRTNSAILDVANELPLYNPLQQQLGMTRIFHGTRHSSLASFYEAGIQPSFLRNDFTFAPAFYASNDPQHAFEDPFHSHLGVGPADTIDPITLMQFEVPTSVLHGIDSPGEGEAPFKVYQFTHLSSPRGFSNFERFCNHNMKTKHSSGHPYDLVIGPIYLPSKNDNPATCFRMKNSNITTTQIAFCSFRSFNWLGQQIKKIYVESFPQV